MELYPAVLTGAAMALAIMVLFGYYPMKRPPMAGCPRCQPEYERRQENPPPDTPIIPLGTASNSQTYVSWQEMNDQISGLREDINRVLNAMANHQHADGRAMTDAQADAK